MTTRWSYVWALLLLLLHLHGVIAGPLQLLRREDATATATISPATTATEIKAQDDETSTQSAVETKTTHRSTTDESSTTFMVTSTTAFPSAINGNSPDHTNSSLATPSPIPNGQLPLAPRLTPGWGVAGALLLISGAAYTLIGIKNGWFYTFFSAAFLTALSVTVLIIYVMVPPVPAAIEGAYVVAAVVSGLIIGGASIVFREITEGLGCLLGGFCVSMWLLTLKAGGLLPSSTPKIIFIIAFTVGSYAFYFSRYTRPYAQIGLMSFAGATVTVLGIDCFSRAGLKEFWAYIWNLNKGLFPYATHTYPMTKGIRVEIAVTVVFTIIGIISQMKLWRVIQARRARKAEEQAEEQRKRDEEETSLGLRIEAQNARERRQWETVYGDQPPQSLAESEDSGVEDVGDEKMKKHRISQKVVRQASSSEDQIELAELPSPELTNSPDPLKSTNGLMMTNQKDDSRVTIRVARDDDEPTERNDVIISEPNDKNVGTPNGYAKARPSSITFPETSQMSPTEPGPEVTPLPFKIPSSVDGNDRDENRSSIAAYADEDDGEFMLSDKPSRLSSAHRLSASSGKLLKSISLRSNSARTSKRKTGEFEAHLSPAGEESTENLIVENPKRYSDMLSIIATIDGLSQDGDDYDRLTDDNTERNYLPEVTVEFGDGTEPKGVGKGSEGEEGDMQSKLKPPGSEQRRSARPISSTETVATDILDPFTTISSSGDLSKRSSMDPSTKKTDSTNENSNPTDLSTVEETPESSVHQKSPAPSTTSNSKSSISLTKDRLPPALTRVALSYRTNEWAKHLSTAEVPDIEELQLESPADRQNVEKQVIEAPVPVDVEELQQTTTSAAFMRRSSSAPNVPQPLSPADHSTSRISSYSSAPKAHIPATLAILTSVGSEAGVEGVSGSSSVPNLPQAGHGYRNSRQRNSSEVYNQPIQEEDGTEPLPVAGQTGSSDEANSTPGSVPPSPGGHAPIPGLVSYSSPQTLLGKREMFLRNRSTSQLLTTPIQESPEYMMRSASQMTLPYNQATPPPPNDMDDIPLSQRKELIRQSSRLSVNSGVSNMIGRPRRISSGSAVQLPSSNTFATNTPPAPYVPTITAESTNFDSHQPQRHSNLPSQAARDARLSQFRQSVAAELRTPTGAMPRAGKETALRTSSSMPSATAMNHAEVSRVIEHQRSMLLSQREMEAQRKAGERWEKERTERVFEEMMRRGDLVDVHREALRKMQGGVKH
ncbi:hypothetical protein F5B22DRAFT_640958 [Xylaria bambusicola]|uniref:uncharacterized protein n=1 Tax=Xylaria bambusicola TaxID=326684 RepID=UPI0020075AA6|nr:uncharacterized protein F5B22DRAFT_640958 [Xylaria bambusicola]KAI0527982.1 hypothetical protein F5B22DRAFT_640958 [Xylaria bambusicola]